MQNVAEKNGKISYQEKQEKLRQVHSREKKILIKLKYIFLNFPHLLHVQRGRCSSWCQTRKTFLPFFP